MSIISKNIPRSGIKVAFVDNDGKRVNGITVDQANQVAKQDPNKKFYFQTGDGLEKELTIDQVNQLIPTDLLPTAPECPTEPQLCGPPLVKFFGAGGIGAAANAIVSPVSSSIIGFDIVDSGFGFFGSPSAEVIDPCGKGKGSRLIVNMEDDDVDTTNVEKKLGSTGGSASTGVQNNVVTTNINRAVGVGNSAAARATVGTPTVGIGISAVAAGGIGTTAAVGIGNSALIEEQCDIPREDFEKQIVRNQERSKKIKNITIVSPGDGYLSSPDGSLGGDERVWKESDEGYVKTKCGGYYVVQPYRPILVRAGDTYYPPDGPPRVLKEDETIELPLVPPVPPPDNVGLSYPIVLCIEEIKVLDGGFGYRRGDRLIITPDNGTIADLIVDDNGRVENVEIIRGGCGFNDLPDVKTDSPTGFNAVFSTIFKPIRIDISKPIEEQIGQTIPEQIELISVVDCIGRVI